ncbi:hypothetical protein D3C87_2032070 [compost metagenome]
MSADFRRLFHHGHGNLGMALLEPDGGRQAGGTGADNQHIGGERFAIAGICHG